MDDSARTEGASGRIRDAAIRLFGEKGVAATSLKSVAAEAGVSQGLVIHHFESKAGLHRACDEYVAYMVRTNKEAAVSGGPQMHPIAWLHMIQESRPLLRYLVRTLSEGGEHVSSLIDDMISDAEHYMARGVEAGFIKPSGVPRERVIVLVLWSLGALVLHEQLHRLLGVDFLASESSPHILAPYLRPVMELYDQGLLVDGAYGDLVGALDHADSETSAPADERPAADRHEHRENP